MNTASRVESAARAFVYHSFSLRECGYKLFEMIIAAAESQLEHTPK